MNKLDIKQRINGLNDYMLSNTDKKLLLLTISSDYTYNKAIAIVDKEDNSNDWYSVDDKNCFKTWNEVELLLTEYVKVKILTFIKNMKDKFVKLIKFYLINFANIVERFGKPTEVSQVKIIKNNKLFRRINLCYLLLFDKIQ